MKNTTMQWLNKYYPIPAKEAVEKGLTGIQCIEHSLRKWRGLRAEVLEAHDLIGNLASEVEEACAPFTKVLSVDGYDCSLCVQYRLGVTPMQGHLRCTGCSSCPIFIATGNDCTDEFKAWDFGAHDPGPMIALLERTLEHFKTREVGIP